MAVYTKQALLHLPSRAAQFLVQLARNKYVQRLLFLLDVDIANYSTKDLSFVIKCHHNFVYLEQELRVYERRCIWIGNAIWARQQNQ